MALAKSRASITQLTASGTSTTLDVSAAYSATLLIRHSNGSGSVTAAASFQVQVKPVGGSTWYTHAVPVASTTTAQVDTIVVALPPDVGSVQVVYTAPTGPSGSTFDAEVATTTGV
jgi:hypothetical protein